MYLSKKVMHELGYYKLDYIVLRQKGNVRLKHNHETNIYLVTDTITHQVYGYKDWCWAQNKYNRILEINGYECDNTSSL